MEVSGKLLSDSESEQCDICRIDGKSEKADGFCNDCNECMCNRYFRHHLKSKSSRNHVMVPVSRRHFERKQEEHKREKCKKHRKEILKYYCRKHDAVGCGDCIIAAHNGCKMDFIRDVAKNFHESPEMRDILRKIHQWEVETDEEEKQQKINEEENKLLSEKALKEIQQFRRDLNDYLDQTEAEIIAKVNRLSQNNEDLLSDIEKMVTKARRDIVELKNLLDTTVCQSEALFIRVLESKSIFASVEQSVSEIKGKNTIRSFSFKENQRLKSLIQSKSKLGALKMLNVRQMNNYTDTIENDKEERNAHEKVVPNAISTQSVIAKDPRLEGFDIGRRVRYEYTCMDFEQEPSYGTITAVYPEGYVDVEWDSGCLELRVSTGYKEEYSLSFAE